MKDLLLINSKFLLKFWAKAMDTSNYLWNHLLTKTQIDKIIPKEA